MNLISDNKPYYAAIKCATINTKILLIHNNKIWHAFKEINSRFLSLSIPVEFIECEDRFEWFGVFFFHARIPHSTWNAIFSIAMISFSSISSKNAFGINSFNLFISHVYREVNELPKSNTCFTYIFLFHETRMSSESHIYPAFEVKKDAHKRSPTELNIPNGSAGIEDDDGRGGVCAHIPIRFPMPFMESWIYSSVKQLSVHTYIKIASP